MVRKRKKESRSSYHIPIDERLIPDVFSFTHVRGVARLFLLLEITLSISVVLGTFILVLLKFFSIYTV